jgi:hypothetical protein
MIASAGAMRVIPCRIDSLPYQHDRNVHPAHRFCGTGIVDGVKQIVVMLSNQRIIIAYKNPYPH